MEPVPVFDLTDERIAPYANLKERTLRGESLFVAEGELVVERLAQSRYAMESVFADESRLPLWNRIAAQCNRQDVPVYTSSTALMKSIVGYDFSMGLMAVGVREQESDASALFNPAFRRLVCLPECVKPDNLEPSSAPPPRWAWTEFCSVRVPATRSAAVRFAPAWRRR